MKRARSQLRTSPLLLQLGQALECGARPLVAGDVGERALVRVRRVREAGAYTIGQSIASDRLLH